MAKAESGGINTKQGKDRVAVSKKPIRRVSRKILAGVLAGELVAGGLLFEGFYKLIDGKFFNPFQSSVSLPTNPCTQLQPIPQTVSQTQETLARECMRMQQRGEIVIVDFDHLGKKREITIAKGVQELLNTESDSLLTPKVLSVPATPQAIQVLRSTEPTGSPKNEVASPPPGDSPSAIAIETMHLEKKYPGAFVVSLSPQYVCNDQGDALGGIAYTDANSGVASVFPNNLGFTGNTLTKEIALDATHEILHLFKLGHGGTITMKRDKRNPKTPIEDILLPDSSYSEYGDAHDGMGSPDPKSSQQPYLNWLQWNDLREASLKGKNPFSSLTIGKNGLVMTEQDVQTNGFALLPLTQPVTLAGFDDSVTFDSFAICAWYNPPHVWGKRPPGPGAYEITYMLFDSQHTQNTALASVTPSVTVGHAYIIDIDGQEVQIAATQKGLAFKPLVSNYN